MAIGQEGEGPVAGGASWESQGGLTHSTRCHHIEGHHPHLRLHICESSCSLSLSRLVYCHSSPAMVWSSFPFEHDSTLEPAFAAAGISHSVL